MSDPVTPETAESGAVASNGSADIDPVTEAQVEAAAAGDIRSNPRRPTPRGPRPSRRRPTTAQPTAEPAPDGPVTADAEPQAAPGPPVTADAEPQAAPGAPVTAVADVSSDAAAAPAAAPESSAAPAGPPAEAPRTGPRTVGRIIADALRAAGVRYAFTVPGESFLGLLDGLGDAGIRVVTTRHEGAAAFMAEAYGQLTGRPAACSRDARRRSVQPRHRDPHGPPELDAAVRPRRAGGARVPRARGVPGDRPGRLARTACDVCRGAAHGPRGCTGGRGGDSPGDGRPAGPRAALPAGGPPRRGGAGRPRGRRRPSAVAAGRASTTSAPSSSSSPPPSGRSSSPAAASSGRGRRAT